MKKNVYMSPLCEKIKVEANPVLAGSPLDEKIIPRIGAKENDFTDDNADATRTYYNVWEE